MRILTRLSRSEILVLAGIERLLEIDGHVNRA